MKLTKLVGLGSRNLGQILDLAEVSSSGARFELVGVICNTEGPVQRGRGLLCSGAQIDGLIPEGSGQRAEARGGIQGAPTVAAGLVHQVNALVQAARAAMRPVIWVRMQWQDRADVGLLAKRSPFLREEIPP